MTKQQAAMIHHIFDDALFRTRIKDSAHRHVEKEHNFAHDSDENDAATEHLIAIESLCTFIAYHMLEK